MTFNSWEFRRDVTVTEILNRKKTYKEIFELMREPVLGFFALMYMISDIEYEVMGIKKRLNYVAGSLCLDNEVIDDQLDNDVDMMWHWYYGRMVDETVVGIHYWKDRMPYNFRVSKYYNGQSKLMMDMLESVLYEKPDHIIIAGSASDTWRAGLASEFAYRFLDVKTVTAYDVFEIGGTYSGNGKKLDFVPIDVKVLNVPNDTLLIDDRWPITVPLKALKFSIKSLTKVKQRQPFFKGDLDSEKRIRSFECHYEEYVPLQCNCYECAWFYNLINYHCVPDQVASKWYEIIFTEAGHLPFHNSEAYLGFLMTIYVRRARVVNIKECLTVGFDQSDIDKMSGNKIGFDKCSSFDVDVDGGVIINNYYQNYINDYEIKPRIELGINNKGYDVRVKRFKACPFNDNDVLDLFINKEKKNKQTRFKIKTVSLIEYSDRVDSVLVDGKILMAGVVKFDQSYQYVELGDTKGCKSIPKGHVAKGETGFEAATREYLEEVQMPLMGNYIRADTIDICYGSFEYSYDIFTYVGSITRSAKISELVIEQRNMVYLIINKINNSEKIDKKFLDILPTKKKKEKKQFS